MQRVQCDHVCALDTPYIVKEFLQNTLKLDRHN
jgi:hypothetical protein